MNRKHIVFLVGSYAPNYSAVGICASSVVNVLKQRYKVTVICINNKYGLPMEEYMDGVRIIRLHPYSSILYDLPHYFSSGLKKHIGKYISFGYRTIQFLKSVFCSKLMINKKLISCYSKAVNQLKSSDAIDCIIGCAFPFESIIAVRNFCNDNKSVKGIAYLFDPFAENKLIYRTSNNYHKKYKYNLNLEKEVLQNLDLVIAMHIWERHLACYYSDCNNIEIAEHPLLLINNDIRQGKYEGRRIMYAGALNAKVRNPLYAFSLIDKLLKSSDNLEFNFYTSDYLNDLDSLEHKYPARFHNHGRKSIEEIHIAEYSNDIMLSIGNSSNTSQTPSKVFEYMSTGNPIIHIAKYKEDPCISVLNKYRQSLILYENVEYDINDILLEISKLSPYTDRSQLSQLFEDATPEFVAKKITQLLHD
jgi:hypothetical protein